MQRDKTEGWLPIISASLLLTFWILFAVFLPMTEPYVNWIMDADWLWINSIGFVGSTVGIFAIYSIYNQIHSHSTIEKIALGMSVTGIVILTSILFFESFILKGIALQNESLIDLNGSFYAYKPFANANLIGGILFSAGMVFLAISMISKKTFKLWSLVLLIIGSPLFGIMLMPGNLRLVGVLLYSIAFISMGVQILKRNESDVPQSN